MRYRGAPLVPCPGFPYIQTVTTPSDDDNSSTRGTILSLGRVHACADNTSIPIPHLAQSKRTVFYIYLYMSF